MTGFGHGEAEAQGRLFSVELRCVNNRYLDTKIKLPRDYSQLEDVIRKMVAEFHHRGRVDLTLSVTGDFSDLVAIKVNTQLAVAYKNSLEELAGVLGIDNEMTLSQFMQLPDVLTREQKSEDIEGVMPAIEAAAHAALKNCAEMRAREASVLAEDLLSRLATFSDVLEQLEEMIPDLLKQRESNLQERLQKLLGTVDLDPMRLAQEVAVIADKTDVTEELVRLKSHSAQFKEILDSTGPVGRKLDFLIQEFLREVNTIASKINDADVAHMTVGLKGELEKMREQVQNIE